MPLHVVSGKANTGKTGIAYERLESAVHEGRRAALVLPSVPDVERARDELALRLPLGLDVTTARGLVGRRWSEYGDGRYVVSAPQRLALLEMLCGQLNLPMSYGRLGTLCVEPLVQQTGLMWRSAEGSVPESGQGLRLLLERYADILQQRDLIEESEASCLLASARDWSGEVLVFHRFVDLTDSQTQLLQGLRHRNDVLLTLTSDRSVPATALGQSLLASMQPDIHTEVCSDPHNTETTLATVADSLFGAKEKLSRSVAVRFGLAEGSRAEANLVVRAAANALSEGVPPEGVVVVFRDPGRHYSELRTAFEEAGIPVQFDVTLPLAKTAMGAALVEALRFTLTGERASLLRFLRSQYSGIDPAVVQKLEHGWRRQGVWDQAEMLRQTAQVSSRLAFILRSISRVGSGTVGSTERDRIAELVVMMHSACGEETFNQDAAVRRSLLTVLNELAELQELELTFPALLRTLRESQVAQTDAEQAGHVQVMSSTRLRGRRFDTVIVGGLNVGEFPPTPNETLLPGTAIDQVLHSFGGRALSGRGAPFEDALFYECVSRARSKLVLLAKTTDDDGETLRVSGYYEEVEEFFRDREADSIWEPDMHEAMSMPPVEASLRSREKLLAGALANNADARVLAAVNRSLCRPSAGEALAPFNEEVFSATQIEAYIACPYRWFHEHVVKPRVLEQAYSAREEGELCHQLLATTFSRLKQLGELPVTPSRLRHAVSTLETVYAEIQEQEASPRNLEEIVGRTRARGWAERVLREDAQVSDDFATVEVEWEFGRTSEPIDLGPFLLAGRIDRIDADADGNMIVVDYKRTATSSHGAKRLLEEGKVQLPLYLLAAAQRMKLRPVAGIYRGLASYAERGVFLAGAPLDRKITRGDALVPLEFDSVLEQALQLAHSAVQGMRRGDTPQTPFTANSCSYCPVADVCGSRK